MPGISEDELLHAAGTAVWHYMIARESLHMFDHRDALKHFDVPPRVMARVGGRPTQAFVKPKPAGLCARGVRIVGRCESRRSC